ncbi:MAG: hypothetical protein JSS63_03740 [Bacteroidetes bacterium]|nr:hypothetical protein [Bacteroidota bacterium]
MKNFNYSISLDEHGNIRKKIRLIRYNSKILAFHINDPHQQAFYDSVEDFLVSIQGCNPGIFEDLTGENIFHYGKNIKNKVFANALTLKIIPEKEPTPF